MRNLKRALSLTLASVMLLGMMVVGSSAAGFPDVDQADNVEAIEVLQAVKVMVGDKDTGNFRPDAPVSRAEMAVVMANLLNLDYNYYASACPFNDVPTWARGCVGACYANKIVSGRSATTYDADASVTAVEAASMMMRALGYFKYAEDYADGFVLSTVRQGNQIGIFSQVGTDGSTPLTRNQVAQMALNALQAEMVDFTGTPGIEVNGVKVGYKAEYTPRTSTELKYRAIENRTSDASNNSNHRGQYYIQLGEELYDGKLRLNDSATDDFYRPSRYWEYDGKGIGTYMKKELLDKTYTDEVTGKMLYDELGSDVINSIKKGGSGEYTLSVAIDGVNIDGKTGATDHNNVLGQTNSGAANSGKPYFDETFMTKTYNSGVGQTGKGVLTQVFIDPDNKEVYVAVINTYLAKATADYNSKKDEAKFDIYALTKTGSGNDTVYYKYVDACKNTAKNAEPLSISVDDFAIAEDVKKDDIVLVTQANGEIKTITQPQVISAATLNGFSKDKYVVTDGTQYDYNTTVDYDPETLDDWTGSTQNLKDTEYNVYLDEYGYLIGVEVVEAVNNYIFVTGIDQGASNRKNKTAEASGILLDGTFIEFTMDTKESVNYWAHGEMNHNDKTDAGKGGFGGGPLWNTWCTYTVDKDGVYTLKEVKGWDELKAANSKEKAGQSRDMNYNNKDIDDKHVSLRAYSFAAASGAGADKYVYGNDKTVYIVPELDEVVSDTTIAVNVIDNPKDNGGSDKSNAGTALTNPGNSGNVIVANSTRVGIISGVDSVATGIANVNLKTYEDVDAIEGASGNTLVNPGFVYTLFDDDGYVIAAIVLGEDDGVSKNLVYSHKDDIESEHYSSADDEWTWTRKVIFNGEEITLTEKGSSISVLEDLKENVWYEMTYKADGTVKSAEYAYYTEDGMKVGDTPSTNSTTPKGPAMTLRVGADPDSGTAGDFVDAIENVEAAINDNKSDGTTLYEQVWGVGKGNATSSNSTALPKTNAPSLKESTLYVNTDANKGFYVDKNVKSVLIQTNDGNSTTSWGSGTSDLEDMLEDLNVDTNGFCFKISAILTNGRATTVIIHDWNETGATPDGSHNSGGNSGTFTWRSNDSAHNFLNPTYKGNTAPTEDDIYDMLVDAGCTDISVDSGAWSFKKSNGMGVKLTIAPKKVVTIKLDGADTDVWNDKTIKDLYEEKYGSGKSNDHIFVKYTANGASATAPASSYDGAALAEGDALDLNDQYLKLTAAPTSATKGTITGPTAAGVSIDTLSDVTGVFTIASNPYLKVGTNLSFKVTVKNSTAAAASEKVDNGLKVTVASGAATQATLTITSPTGGVIAAADTVLDSTHNIEGTVTCSVALPTTLSADTTLTITVLDAA